MAKKCNETKTCVFGNGEYCGYNEYMTDSAVCPRLLDKYATVTTITMEQIMRSKETEARND
jgi:hypothetical protein